jgi:hypothetical protein
MTWQQTLVVALIPSAITAISLIVQQLITNGREAERLRHEERERQKEREHALDLAAKQRSYAVTDAWREDRKAAHKEAYAALVEYQREFRLRNFTMQMMSSRRTGKIISPTVLEAQARSSAAVSIIKLIGGKDAAKWAAEAYRKLSTIQTRISIEGKATDRLELVNKVSEDIDEYVACARRELETDN